MAAWAVNWPIPDNAMLDHLNIGSLAWWMWAILAGLLVWGLTGEALARDAAMALAFLQAVGYLWAHRSASHFPTQLRIAYALWLAVSLMQPLFVMYWILAAGTAARVLTGYCAMARLLLLLPWNRSAPLTWQRMAIIAFHPPVHGSVVTGLPL
jgi:hypothetical protein